MNLTRLTQHYIAGHPSIKDALRRGLINYSALAREICREHKIRQLDAVIVACRRYHARIKSQIPTEKIARDLIARAKLRVRGKISVIILEKPKDFSKLYEVHGRIRSARGDLNLIEGEETITLVTNTEFVPLVLEKFKTSVIKQRQHLVQITLLFDKRIETTSGVVSLIYSLLSAAGINILEEMSCWTDVMLILEEKDLTAALNTLTKQGQAE